MNLSHFVKRGPLIFGMVDGLSIILGLLLGTILVAQSESAIWHIALSGGLAELGGMSLGQYWADEQEGQASKSAAVWNGVGACLACVLPGIPYLILFRGIATVISLGIIAATGGIICWLRPEHGIKAVGRTYGLLLLVGILTAASSFG